MADVKFGAILQHPGIPEMTVMFLRRGNMENGFESFKAVLLTNRTYPNGYTRPQLECGNVMTLWTVESWTLLHE